jgi:hypothetical protein
MEYDIDSGNTQRKSQVGSDVILDWEKVQELRSGKYSECEPVAGSYNFLLEVAGVTPSAYGDWFVA